jgi:peptidoglycan hydrolase CwlO-like protein
MQDIQFICRTVLVNDSINNCESKMVHIQNIAEQLEELEACIDRQQETIQKQQESIWEEHESMWKQQAMITRLHEMHRAFND